MVRPATCAKVIALERRRRRNTERLAGESQGRRRLAEEQPAEEDGHCREADRISTKADAQSDTVTSAAARVGVARGPSVQEQSLRAC
jgi:hypothetical protein